MPTVAQVDVTTDGRMALRSPYDPLVVQTVKDAIPYTFREWRKGEKVWLIAPEWGDVVVQMLHDVGVKVVDNRLKVLPAAVPADLQRACTILEILPTASLAVAEAVYKTQAKKYHPDHGGDTAKMQELNEAMRVFKAYTTEDI
jgi:hypothetical protein